MFSEPTDPNALCKAYVPENLFETGIGQVLIYHRKADGWCECGGFLLDVFCLGVKDAFFEEADEREIRRRVEGYSQELGRLRLAEPLGVRKLIEDAVAYARNLGFSPHRDYKKARKIFRRIPAGSCSTTFPLGKDGKPFYISGPSHSPEKVNVIMSVLRAKCGSDGFHYLIEDSQCLPAGWESEIRHN